MRIVHDLARTHLPSPTHVTIGVFDGVHRGHQQLIAAMVAAAHAAGAAALALAFDPHPATTLGDTPPPLLTTIDERADLLEALGLDVLLLQPFTKALAGTPAVDFVEALLRHLRLATLWGGPDLALGRRREGNIPFLQQLGTARGFDVRVVEPLLWKGAPVSSSRVRDALRAGDIGQATGCLGRPYRLTGTVVRGDGRGHRIGVPTANLSPTPKRMIPASGIYACMAHVEGLGTHLAAVNVGTRPTFGQHALTVEAHLLDFEADLYGRGLALDFVARLREERSFGDVETLVSQMHRDIASTRDILASSKT